MMGGVSFSRADRISLCFSLIKGKKYIPNTCMGDISFLPTKNAVIKHNSKPLLPLISFGIGSAVTLLRFFRVILLVTGAYGWPK